MAKRRRVAVAPSPVRVLHEHDPVVDARNRRLVVGAIAAVLLVAFGIAAFGYYETYFQPPRRTALVVGERSFSAGDLMTRVKLALADAGGIDPENPSLPDPEEVLNQMRDEEVVRQASSSFGFTTEESEVDGSIAERLGVEFGGPGTPFDTAYRDELRRSGLTDGEYHQLIEADVLEKKVIAAMNTALPEVSDQIELDVILVPTEEEAKTVITRIQGTPTVIPLGGVRGEKDGGFVTVFLGGEDFASVATSASQDTETASVGGSMEWTPYGVLEPTLEKAAFALERGKLSDPIQTGEGYWVIQVTNRRLGALIDSTTRDGLVVGGYDAWLEAEASRRNAEAFLDDDMRTWVLTEALE